MVSCACAFSQSELGKYFEGIIIIVQLCFPLTSIQLNTLRTTSYGVTFQMKSLPN